MAEQDTRKERHGTLLLEDRKKLSLGGVRGILSFSDDAFMLATDFGKLCGEGSGLSVESLDRASGKILVVGRFDALYYRGEESEKGESVGWLRRRR